MNVHTRGVPTLAWGGGTYLGQGVPILTRGTYLGQGVPTLARGYIPWWGYPMMGVPPVRDGIPPGVGQQMKYSICCGQYASCVHTGGLSCYWIILDNFTLI